MENKVEIIIGSSRKDGDTKKLIDKVLDFQNFDIIDLNNYQISYYDYDNGLRINKQSTSFKLKKYYYMQSKCLILTLFVSALFFQAKSQEMTYLQGGRILFENQTIQKPSEILSIASKKESPELLATFNKYQSSRGAGQVLGYIGGFGIGYSLGGLISGKKVNTGLLAGGAGVAIIGLLLNNSANTQLQKVVDLYNSKSPNKVSFQPLLQRELGITKLGIVANF